jgi:hypothetical protein
MKMKKIIAGLSAIALASTMFASSANAAAQIATIIETAANDKITIDL